MNEVKRQAMSELQKAVSDAERKAHEMISAERSKMERALAEAKRQASEDALSVINQQEDSSEVCLILSHILTHTHTQSAGPHWDTSCLSLIATCTHFTQHDHSHSPLSLKIAHTLICDEESLCKCVLD